MVATYLLASMADMAGTDCLVCKRLWRHDKYGLSSVQKAVETWQVRIVSCANGCGVSSVERLVDV